MLNFANVILVFPKMFLFLLGWFFVGFVLLFFLFCFVLMEVGSSGDHFFHLLRNKCQEGSPHKVNRLGEQYSFFFSFTQDVLSVMNIVICQNDVTFLIFLCLFSCVKLDVLMLFLL